MVMPRIKGKIRAARGIPFLLLLVFPAQASAQSYLVRPGDTLTAIASRYHVRLAVVAHANHLANINLVRAGQVLVIPSNSSTGASYYRVKWGDTLSGIALSFRTSIPALRNLNPTLGRWPIAGQLLRVCSGCGSVATAARTSTGGGVYRVRPGDTLSSIAARFGTTTAALSAANQLQNPNVVVLGSTLRVPSGASAAYDPSQARALITTYSRYYGLDPTLPLAVAWQESGFNQSEISKTGAVGVMQIEPATGRTISALFGRPVDIYNIQDNIQAGTYWLSHLLAYYGNDRFLAVAAYYEGTRNIARRGLFRDTRQYVADVLALQQRLGG